MMQHLSKKFPLDIQKISKEETRSYFENKTTTIFGPPGTGKTHTLLSIVEKHLDEGYRPEEIGYFAYTKKAANEAIDRATSKFEYEEKDFEWFRTLHSMAFKQLNLTTKSVMKDRNYKELGKKLQIKEFLNANNQIEDNGQSMQKNPFMRIIELARNNMVNINTQWRRSQGHVEGGFEELERIYETYIDYKQEHELYDFNDMLLELVNEGVVPSLPVIIIDEAQDLSMLQWYAVILLAKSTKHIYIAGDDDQAIFKWAGAIPEMLMRTPGNKKVLNQSFRIPKRVYDVAESVANKIKVRVKKEWSPTSKTGDVTHYSSIEYVPFNKDGEYYVLARTKYVLQKVEEYFKREGIIYNRFNKNKSISEKVCYAINCWNKLVNGDTISLGGAKNMYKYIPGDGPIKRGFKTWDKALEDDIVVSYNDLVNNHGLRVPKDLAWNDVLTLINEDVILYIRKCERRGQDINAIPKIKILTIHGSKGGEADNVVLLSELSRKSHTSLLKNGDDERRVFYTGITRTKKNLFLVRSSNDYEYSEMFLRQNFGLNRREYAD
jgi:superfamily I DNA/RNA helicase|tara:strand:+ start:358 stop:2004 length:1647 start_codon:yes stop_codon:yes gene_type:complete